MTVIHGSSLNILVIMVLSSILRVVGHAWILIESRRLLSIPYILIQTLAWRSADLAVLYVSRSNDPSLNSSSSPIQAKVRATM